MDDEAQVGFVEPHPQRAGRHQRLDPVVAQRFLEPQPVDRVGTSGVGRHVVARPPQRGGHVLGARHGQRVDDAAAGEIAEVGHQPGQPLLGGAEREDPQPQRVASQPAPKGEHVVSTGAQLLGHVGDDPRVGRGGGGEDRRVRRQRGQQVADAPVVGPEVVTPVADAVGLVDDEQPAAPRQPRQLLLTKPRVVEPFRADQQQVDLVGGQRLADVGPVLRVGGVHRHGADPRALRGGDLVAHEGQQGRHDHRGSGPGCAQQGGGDDVDRGLAPSGALDDEHPPALRDERLDRLELPGPEVRLAPDEAMQGLGRLGGDDGGGGGHAPTVCAAADAADWPNHRPSIGPVRGANDSYGRGMPQPTTSGMSVAQGAALTIGAVLGTGVISLPAMAAGIAGPASILAWLALVVLSAPLALTFAALGARFPDAGGSRRMRGGPSGTTRPPRWAGCSTSSSPWAPHPPRPSPGLTWPTWSAARGRRRCGRPA